MYKLCWTVNAIVFFIGISLDTCVSASSGETAETDSTLITELLSIQLDMKTYQQDKKQLQ